MFYSDHVVEIKHKPLGDINTKFILQIQRNYISSIIVRVISPSLKCITKHKTEQQVYWFSSNTWGIFNKYSAPKWKWIPQYNQ